jgi:hypothetical protein
MKETTAMRKVRIAFLLFLSGFPLMLRGQFISYELGVVGGPTYTLKPAYFRNFYRSSGTFGARLTFLHTEHSGAEFDFGTVGFKLNGAKYLAALTAPVGYGSTVGGGGIRIDFGTLSYLRFLIPAESGLGFYMLAGFGLDHVAADPIRTTVQTSESEAPAVRDIDTITAGYFPSLCGGMGLTIQVFEKVGLFGEARIHYVFSGGGNDIVTGGKIKDFTDFWTPAVGLKYGL